MKKLVSLLLSTLLLLALGIPALASSEEPSSEEPSAEVTAEPVELLHPGIQYLEGVTVGGVTTGGGFYVYASAESHDYDLLSSFMNGVIFVYTDEPITDEAAAQALVSELGLDEIAESFPAFVVIPKPLNGEKWTDADLDLYWEAQFALAGGLVNTNTQPPQGEYTRHTMNSLQYIIGEGSGATFINNVLSQNAVRIAGVVTFGGEISADLPIGLSVPAYLVNPSEDAVAYWKTANGTDAEYGKIAYNSAYRDDFSAPMVQEVILIGAGHSNADYMATIAWDFLSRFVRNADGSLGEN